MSTISVQPGVMPMPQFLASSENTRFDFHMTPHIVTPGSELDHQALNNLYITKQHAKEHLDNAPL